MEIEGLIDALVGEIRQVKGVIAVVLGGSRARGTHKEKSDIDLGIYYSPERALDLETLNRVASHFDDERREQILTQPGGWGPWINGGGWLKVEGVPVDFLYRDLGKVRSVMAACLNGQVEIVYQAGHPLGFLSSMYMGEIAICKPLWEAERQDVTALKAQTWPFPRALQKALIDKFAWEISFSLGTAHKASQRKDVVYAAGSCFRSAACMLQTLFAVNGQYWLNEKGAVALVESFELRPRNFQARIESAFGALAAESEAIETAIDMLTGLAEETLRLSEVVGQV